MAAIAVLIEGAHCGCAWAADRPGSRYCGPAGHQYDRVLTAKMTAVCVLVACLFPGGGYDTVLAAAFGLPGEQAMKRIFEIDAAAGDMELGPGFLRKGLEVTAIDGTTMELAGNDALAGESGTPADGANALADQIGRHAI